MTLKPFHLLLGMNVAPVAGLAWSSVQSQPAPQLHEVLQAAH